MLLAMHQLILASETVEHASTTPAGDEFMTAALVLLGIVMLIAAVATWRITPKLEH